LKKPKCSIRSAASLDHSCAADGFMRSPPPTPSREAGSFFQQCVYAVARSIPPGATLSYGEIAARLGDRGAARDVGEAMGLNPFPIIVPCHRVLAAGGKVGGFSASGLVTTKLRLLDIEGAQVGEAPTLFESLPLAVGPRRR
jgi:methylated-DNA-[protein]-cysteine S-methyltransferase